MAKQTIKTIQNINDIQSPNATVANALNANYFNTIKAAVEESVYLGADNDNGSDIANTICSFTANTNVPSGFFTSGDKLSVILEKIYQYLFHLSNWAFKPSDEKIKTSEIGSGAITPQTLGVIVEQPKNNENTSNGFTVRLVQNEGSGIGIVFEAKDTIADTATLGNKVEATAAGDSVVSFKVNTTSGDKIVTLTW